MTIVARQTLFHIVYYIYGIDCSVLPFFTAGKIIEKLEICMLLCHYWKQDVKVTEEPGRFAKWEAQMFPFVQHRNGSESSTMTRQASKISHSFAHPVMVDSEALCEVSTANPSMSTRKSSQNSVLHRHS